MAKQILKVDNADVRWEANWSGTGCVLKGLFPFRARVWWESDSYRVSICDIKLKKQFKEQEEAKKTAEKILHAWLSRGAIIIQKFIEPKPVSRPQREPRKI